MDGQYFEFGLADALGSVRAEITALKEREAHLRAAILASRSCETGREFEVFIRTGTSRRINRAALPDAVLTDRRFWTETSTTTVITRPRNAPPSAREDRRHVSHLAQPERKEEDFTVIEDI